MPRVLGRAALTPTPWRLSMSRKSFSPALPHDEQLPPLLGFTAWVELHRTSAADVLLYRRALDAYLARQSLLRSMNPLHLLVWSATRSLTVVDQVEMLAWMAMEGGIERACLTSVRSHVGIPAERRAPLLSVQLSDPCCQAVLLAYPESAQSAECVLEQLR